MDITAASECELRQKVLDLCEIFRPKPIIVRTDAFPDSFLVGKQYHHSNKRGVFESISFRYNPDNPFVIEAKRRKSQKEPEPTPEEFPRRMQTMIMMLPFMMAWAQYTMARGMGYETFQEYMQKTSEINAKARETTSNCEEADRLARQEIYKRYYEHGGKGSYVELANPEKTLYKTTILFRVIGKNVNAVSRCHSYYLRQRGISYPVFSNVIPDATEHIGPWKL